MPLNFLQKLTEKLDQYLTIQGETPDFSQSREARTGLSREPVGKEQTEKIIQKYSGKALCPHCVSEKHLVRRGKRQKKRETVQLYFCKACQRTFTPQFYKGKHYPLEVILEGLSLYNLGYTLEEVCRKLKERFGFALKPSTLNNWLDEFQELCRYSRMRRFGKKLFSPKEVAPGISLYHRQIYKFRLHRAKMVMLLNEDQRHFKLRPLQEFLEAMYAECPHHLFKEDIRASEVKVKFDLKQVQLTERDNYAKRLARLVLESVKENKLRHDALQRFFLYNDSVTVATEVPVYLLPEDIEHMESKLDFEIPVKFEKVLTGHIDILQLRNGAVHILDYKPNAAKERPVEQLTLYALALSRLTGLRVYDFKCAWFDEHHYFEFFPLHVIYKLRESQPRVAKGQRKLMEVREVVA